jgi:hypothetical protein
MMASGQLVLQHATENDTMAAGNGADGRGNISIPSDTGLHFLCPPGYRPYGLPRTPLVCSRRDAGRLAHELYAVQCVLDRTAFCVFQTASLEHGTAQLGGPKAALVFGFAQSRAPALSGENGTTISVLAGGSLTVQCDEGYLRSSSEPVRCKHPTTGEPACGTTAALIPACTSRGPAVPLVSPVTCDTAIAAAAHAMAAAVSGAPSPIPAVILFASRDAVCTL